MDSATPRSMRACRISLALATLIALGCEPDATTPHDPPSPIPAAGSAAPAQPDFLDRPGPPPEVERPYREGASAAADIERALTRARAGEQRVLLMFGANWCHWCRRLDWLLTNDATISAELNAHWQVVHVDVGRGRANPEVVARYGNPVRHGLPVLVVLDADGSPLHTQETGSLEVRDRHDPARVLRFLRRFAPG